jgi:hypothetical protein
MAVFTHRMRYNIDFQMQLRQCRFAILLQGESTIESIFISAMGEIEMENRRKAIDKDIESLLDKCIRVTFRFVVYSLLALPRGAHTYDIEAYCQQVGAAADGGAKIEAACREQERTAKDNISQMSVPPHIMNYCQEVGQSAGGSYQFMEACIKEESKAKDKLY